MGRQAAIRDARIESLEGGEFIVRTPNGDTIRVPVEVVCDESEVWRIGDNGTLLVENWWARRRELRSARLSDPCLETIPVKRKRAVQTNKFHQVSSEQEPSPEPEKGIDPEVFRAMISDDLSGQLDKEDSEILRHPDNVQLYRAELIQMKLDLEEKLSQRQIRFKAFANKCYRLGSRSSDTFFHGRDDYEAWRGRMLAAKRKLEKRIGETKQLIRSSAEKESDVKSELWDLVLEAEKRICDPRWRAKCTELRRRCGKE